MILVVEDLHWVDKTSEDFLTYLIGWLANTRILLILLYRPDYTHPWANRSYYSRLGLDELPMAARYQLLESAPCPARLLRGGLRDFVISRAGGNPLFIEELTSALQEKGVHQQDRRWLHAEQSKTRKSRYRTRCRASSPPVSIDSMKTSSERCRLLRSSAGNSPFPFLNLSSSQEPKSICKKHLQELQGLEFVYEESLFPELRYIFKHALVQEVAYNTLLLKRRREIHGKIGQAIETLYAERLEEFYEMLAYHYARSELMAIGHITYLKALRYQGSKELSVVGVIPFLQRSHQRA